MMLIQVSIDEAFDAVQRANRVGDTALGVYVNRGMGNEHIEDIVIDSEYMHEWEWLLDVDVYRKYGNGHPDRFEQLSLDLTEPVEVYEEVKHGNEDKQGVEVKPLVEMVGEDGRIKLLNEKRLLAFIELYTVAQDTDFDIMVSFAPKAGNNATEIPKAIEDAIVQFDLMQSLTIQDIPVGLVE